MKYPSLFIALILLMCSEVIAQKGDKNNESPTRKVTIIGNTTVPKEKRNTRIIWTKPTGEGQLQENRLLEFEVRIESDEPINRDDIYLELNGGGVSGKADVVDFGKSGIEKEVFIYTNTVELSEGKNRLTVILDRAGSPKKQRSYTKTLIIEGNSYREEGALLQSQGIYWEKPKWSSSAQILEDQIFNVRSIINTSAPILVGDVKVLRNGRFYERITDAKLKKLSEGKYEFTCQVTPDVATTPEGYLEYKIMIRSGRFGVLESEPLYINYSPTRPNIHILSIGTQTTLNYTMKDAEDFAKCFDTQARDKGGLLFNQVYSDLLLGSNATTTEIRKGIDKLKTRYKNNKIGSKDLIILYLSSHGFLGDDKKLRIQAEDYDPAAPTATSISYETDIISILESIPCKKLIFIDACYSGDARNNNIDIDHALDQLNQVHQGFTTIVSSEGDEASYEDEAWQNGAFTEGILEGLLLKRANKDNNSYISINELWNYLRTRVPEMVINVKKGKSQHPSLKQNDLGDVAIYYINQKR